MFTWFTHCHPQALWRQSHLELGPYLQEGLKLRQSSANLRPGGSCQRSSVGFLEAIQAVHPELAALPWVIGAAAQDSRPSPPPRPARPLCFISGCCAPPGGFGFRSHQGSTRLVSWRCTLLGPPTFVPRLSVRTLPAQPGAFRPPRGLSVPS